MLVKMAFLYYEVTFLHFLFMGGKFIIKIVEKYGFVSYFDIYEAEKCGTYVCAENQEETRNCETAEPSSTNLNIT